MPRICENCRHYSSDDAEAACPTCGSTLRYTMLPDPATPEPPRPGRAATTSSSGTSLGLGHVWEQLIGSPIGLVVLFVLALAATWAISEWVFFDGGPGKDMGSRVKIGMHFSEVGRVLDVGPPPQPSYPRMRDHFPADEFGDGRLDYEGYGVKLTVYFQGGYVTSVEESKSPHVAGLYQYKYIMRER